MSADADSIIVKCLLDLFVPLCKKSISKDIWNEALRRLYDAGIRTYHNDHDVKTHFWQQIFPNLNLDQDIIDRIMYGKLLKIKGIRVVMKQEGDQNRVADDILAEAKGLVEYARFDDFTPARLKLIKNLTRNDYHINLDDPHLKLTPRMKLKLVTLDEIESTINEPVPHEERQIATPEPIRKPERITTLEKKGSTSIFTVSKGHNVHIIEKDDVFQYIAIPQSQDPLMAALNESERSPMSPPPAPPATFRKIFDPPHFSTQEMLMSPIREIEPEGPRESLISTSVRTNLSELNIDDSFSLLSVSQQHDQSHTLHHIFEPETQPNPMRPLLPADQNLSVQESNLAASVDVANFDPQTQPDHIPQMQSPSNDHGSPHVFVLPTAPAPRPQDNVSNTAHLMDMMFDPENKSVDVPDIVKNPLKLMNKPSTSKNQSPSVRPSTSHDVHNDNNPNQKDMSLTLVNANQQPPKKYNISESLRSQIHQDIAYLLKTYDFIDPGFVEEQNDEVPMECEEQQQETQSSDTPSEPMLKHRAPPF